jgi:hypothetical protein
MVGTVILKISHGYEVREGADPLVDLIDSVTEHFSIVTSPGAFLVDTFPFLRYLPSWLPGTGFIIPKEVSEWKSTFEQFADVPHEFVKGRMVRSSNCMHCASH